MVDNLKLFSQNATEFESNGLGFLSDATKCVVEEERNGIFELELEYPMTGKRLEDLQLRNIIVAKPNPYDDPQPFRIYQISKPIKGVVTVNARHISYDLSDWVCLPFLTFDSKGPGRTVEGDYFPSLMTRLQSNKVTYGVVYDPDNNFPFHFDTDMQLEFLWLPTTGGEYKDADDHRFKFFRPGSVRSVLGDSKECGVLGKFINSDPDSPYYGQRCEIKYDGYDIHILQNRGENRGFEVRYGKNMTDLDHSDIADKDYTAIFPYWKSVNSDDTTVMILNDKAGQEYVSIPGASDQYRKFLIRDLSSDFENKPNAADMRRYANDYIQDEELKGIPTTNVTVNFQELSKSSEYARFKALERVQLCDIVTVIHEGLGIRDEKKVIKTTYNVLSDQYDSIDLGDPRDELANTVSKTVNITNVTDNSTNIIDSQVVSLDLGSTVKQLTTIYYLKTNDTPVPTPNIIVIDTDATKENTWLAVEPVAKHDGTLYTAQQRILSAGEATWSEISLSKAVNAVKSLIDTDENTGVNTLAGDKITAESVDTTQLADGAVETEKIEDHAVIYDKLAVDAIHSGNYKEIEAWSSSKSYTIGDYVIKDDIAYECKEATSGAWDLSKWKELPTTLFSDEGTFFDLSSNGLLQSRNFAIDSDGTVYLRGDIYANGGNLGGWSITSDGLVYSGTVGQTRIDFSPDGSLYANGSTPYIDATGELVMRISVNSSGVDPEYRAVFAIGKDGKVYATKGEIAGWKVENDTFVHESTGSNPDVYLFGTTSSTNKFEAGSPIGTTIAASSAVTNLVMRVGDASNATFAIDENGAIYAMEGHIGSLILDENGLSYIGEDQIAETETVIGFKDYGVAIEDKKGYSTSLYSSRFYALKSGTNLYTVFGPGHVNAPILSMEIAAEIADSNGDTIAGFKMTDPQGQLTGHWIFYDKHQNYDPWVSGESYVRGDKVSYRASSSDEWVNYRLARETYNFSTWMSEYWDPIPPESLDGVYLNDDLTMTLEQRLQQLKDQVISYLPPIATSNSVGVVRIGTGLSINSDTGRLDVNVGGISPATTASLGGVIVGSGLTVSANGLLSAPFYPTNTPSGANYILTATSSTTVAPKYTTFANVAERTGSSGAQGQSILSLGTTENERTSSGAVGILRLFRTNTTIMLNAIATSSSSAKTGRYALNPDAASTNNTVLYLTGTTISTATDGTLAAYERGTGLAPATLSLTVSNGTLSLLNGGLSLASVSLPMASSTTLGMVKVATDDAGGSYRGIVRDSAGQLTLWTSSSASEGDYLRLGPDDTIDWGGLPTATNNTPGIVQLGTGSTQAAAGNHTHTVSVTYESTTATATLLGFGTRYRIDVGGSYGYFLMPNSPVTNPGENDGYVLTATGGGSYGWMQLPTATSNVAGVVMVGNSAGKVSPGDHTHTTSIIADTTTNTAITLDYAGRYKIEAGGTAAYVVMPNSPILNPGDDKVGYVLKVTSEDGSYDWQPIPNASSSVRGLVSLGTGSTQAAFGNHTHTTSISPYSSSGSGQVLSFGGSYMFGVGGTSAIFTLPSNPIPTVGTGNLGKVLTADDDGTYGWQYLPIATDTVRGTVVLGYTTSAAGRNYALQIDSSTNKAFVNVPWSDHIYTGGEAITVSSNGSIDVKLYYNGFTNQSGLFLENDPEGQGLKVFCGSYLTVTSSGALTVNTGTTSTTVAKGNHTHTLSIGTGSMAADITKRITLNSYSWYTLTVGSEKYAFRTPYDSTTCLIEGTKILMSDGSEKNIEDVVPGDIVMSYDLTKGSTTSAVVLANNQTGAGNEYANHLFDDGSFIVTYGKHNVYNKTLGYPEDINKFREGDETLNSAGETIGYVGCMSYFARVRRPIPRYQLITSNNLYFANGVLNGTKVMSKYRILDREGVEIPKEIATVAENEEKIMTDTIGFMTDPAYIKEVSSKLVAKKRLQNEIKAAKTSLADTDYIVQKYTEGLIDDDKWKKSKSERSAWRETINNDEPEIKRLNSEIKAIKRKYAVDTITSKERFERCCELDNKAFGLFKSWLGKVGEQK